ncbi:MAG: hypothetical protein AAF561_06435 [Planctomycetota bacterium]
MPNTISTLTLAAASALALTTATSQADVIEQFLLDDSAGTELEGATNTGTLGNAAFNAGLDFEVNGDGQYIIDSQARAFPRAEIAKISEGQIYYRVDFAGWNLDDHPGKFRNTQFGLFADAGPDAQGIELLVEVQLNQVSRFPAGLRFRYSDGDSKLTELPGFSGRTDGLSQVETDMHSIVIGLDIASGNYAIYVDDSDGNGYEVAATGTTPPLPVDSIRLAVNGDYDSGDDFVSIDSIQLSNDAADFGVEPVQ